MAFYSRSVREESASGRNTRTNTSESACNSAAVQQQLGELMKMMKDQKEAFEACLTANTKLSGKVSNLQESVATIKNQLKENSHGSTGRKKIPFELSVSLNRAPAKAGAWYY